MGLRAFNNPNEGSNLQSNGKWPGKSGFYLDFSGLTVGPQESEVVQVFHHMFP